MYKDLPAHQRSFLFICQVNKKEETKTFKPSSKVPSDHHINKGHTTFSRKPPTKSPYFYIYLVVPSLPSLCFLIHCSKVFPPHNLVYFTELLIFSALFQNFRVAYPHVFCWIGLSKLQKTNKKTQPPKGWTYCFHSQSMKQMQNIQTHLITWFNVAPIWFNKPYSCPRKHNCLIPIKKQECTLDLLAVGKKTRLAVLLLYPSEAKQTYSP